VNVVVYNAIPDAAKVFLSSFFIVVSTLPIIYRVSMKNVQISSSKVKIVTI